MNKNCHEREKEDQTHTSFWIDKGFSGTTWIKSTDVGANRLEKTETLSYISKQTWGL